MITTSSLYTRLVLLLVIFGLFAFGKSVGNELEADSFFDAELGFTSSAGVYFRFGNDFTYRRYGRVLAQLDWSTGANVVGNILLFQMIRSAVMSVVARWTPNTAATNFAGIATAFIFPEVVKAMHSWFTGKRLGSEQIQVNDPLISRQFYLELDYGWRSSHQRLGITPFPGKITSLLPLPQNDPLPHLFLWQALYNAAIRHQVEHIELAWSDPVQRDTILIQLSYVSGQTSTASLKLLNPHLMAESIEALLHNNLQGEKSAVGSLLNDIVIQRVVDFITRPDEPLSAIEAQDLVSELEFDHQNYSGTMSLCSGQVSGCTSNLQLLWAPLPIPHFRPVLFGQQLIKHPVDTAINQLADVNRAELVVRLIEQEVFRRFTQLLSRLPKNNMHSRFESSPAFASGPVDSDSSGHSLIASKNSDMSGKGNLEPVRQTMLTPAALWIKKHLTENVDPAIPPLKWLYKLPLLRGLPPAGSICYVVDPQNTQNNGACAMAATTASPEEMQVNHKSYDTGNTQSLKAYNRRWNEVNNIFNRDGLIVKMFASSPKGNLDLKMRNFYSKKEDRQWVSASLVVPGTGGHFRSGNAPLAGLAYPPGLIKTKAHFRSNAFTGHIRNERNGLNRCVTFNGKWIKNHANKKSLIQKMLETYYRTSSFAFVTQLTSGHIDENGIVVPGKNKFRPATDSDWNEVIADFDGHETRPLALVLGNFDSQDALGKLIGLLMERGIDPDTPIIFHDQNGRFNSLGSIRHFLEWSNHNSKLHQHQWDEKLATLAVSMMPDDYFNVIVRMISRLESSREPVKEFNYLDYFSVEDCADTLLPNPGNTECFSDNLTRLVELLLTNVNAVRLPRLIGSAVEANVKDLSRRMRQTLMGSLLVTIAYRQLFEDSGMDFSDDEAVLLAFATILQSISPYSDHPVKTSFFRFVTKESPSGIQDDILKALNNPDAKYDNGKRYTVYAHILKAARQLEDRNWPDTAWWQERVVGMRAEDQQAIAEVVGVIHRFLLFWHTENNKITPKITSLLDKRTSWPETLRLFQMFFREMVANNLRSQSPQPLPEWPHAELSLVLPEMSLLELLYALGGGHRSLLVKALTDHYLGTGFPSIPGTINQATVTAPAVETIIRENNKHPDARFLSSIPRVFQRVRLRPHEHVLPLGNQFSIDENLKDLVSLYQNLVPPCGFISYVEASDSSSLIEQTVGSFEQSEAQPGTLRECAICKEASQDNGRFQFIKTPCGHFYHKGCIQQSLSYSGNCPYCRKTIMLRKGPQPSGTLSWCLVKHVCDVSGCHPRFFKITYWTLAGSYTASCGLRCNYPSDTREAYIPDTDKGMKAFRMLQDAYKRGFALQVGYSLSRHRDHVVVWSDVPHKTSLNHGRLTSAHGYPDAGYLDRLIVCLKTIGIAEPD